MSSKRKSHFWMDGSDLTGIVFSGPMFPGPFRLEIDDLELR